MSARPPVTFLSRLNDVQLSSPADGQALIFNGGLVKWQNLAVPGGELATLSDVLIGTPLDGQLLMFSGGSWINYGPLNFSDIIGNIAIAQMANGAGADATHYWRGDNTWAAPPVGSIPVTLDVLVGDNSGNAVPSTLLIARNADSTVTVAKGIVAGDTALKVQNPALSSGATASVMLSGFTGDPGATLRYYEGSYPTTGLIQNTDASLTSSIGRLLISGKNYIIFSNDGTALATERMRLGLGLMLGTVVDKGAGSINVSGGFYVNDNKIGGVATLASTVDQTSASETIHIVYTVPANTVKVGTTFRIFAWGNIDNPTAAPTFTPRIRWGGTAGVQLIATPTIVSTSTAQNNKDWELNARVTITALGNALTGRATAMLHVGNHTQNSTGAFASDMATSGATALNIDTTINKDIALTWTISSPSGTPHVRTFGGVIEIVEP